MSRIKSTKGFTLIELVIVLAIAALILAGVLIAVGGAQRSQRDTARKNIAGRLASAIANFQSNNDGTVVGFTCVAGSGYCNGLTDPDSLIAPKAGNAPDGTAANGGDQYTLGENCANVASNRSYQVWYFVENAGNAKCQDNS